MPSRMKVEIGTYLFLKYVFDYFCPNAFRIVSKVVSRYEAGNYGPQRAVACVGVVCACLGRSDVLLGLGSTLFSPGARRFPRSSIRAWFGASAGSRSSSGEGGPAADRSLRRLEPCGGCWEFDALNNFEHYPKHPKDSCGWHLEFGLRCAWSRKTIPEHN